MVNFSSLRNLRVPWDKFPKRGLEDSNACSGCFPAGVSPLGPDEWFRTPKLGIGEGIDITQGGLTAGDLAAGADGKGR